VTTLIIGCGYLGQRLGALLHQQGECVFGTVRSPQRAAEIARLGIEPVIADVLDLDSLAGLPAAERVFYSVGFDRSSGFSMHSVYVEGLQHVLGLLSPRVIRFVYASSTGVYGQTEGDWVDEGSPANPQHESGRISLQAEQCVGAWAESASRGRSIVAIVLRFAGLYGPDRVVRRTLLEQEKPVPGDPRRYLNLIHIDDAARSGVAALETTAAERLYLIGDDRPVSRQEYYSTIAGLLGTAQPRFEPSLPGTPESSRDATNKRVCNERMKHRLGITLQYPDITTGLPAAIR
jgi:nucleoside-diphosphate-sugar epimerase